jgi:exodeoxyribonuclease VII small subunit
MEEKKFEDALRELEAIVKRLESGELSLEESLTTFEQGVSLSKYCFQKLEEAEKRVSILMKDDGGVRRDPFDTGEGRDAKGD